VNLPRPGSLCSRAAVVTLSAAVIVARVLGLRRVVVEGTSMYPTLAPGDRLLVVRAWRVRVGDLVAVPDPRRPGRLLVKRVVGQHRGQLELRGDNPAASTDSRIFGPVPRSSVRGRVVRRYAPPDRRGRAD
jgi:nickel-type superoxide dismutase maturation protease